MRNRSQAIITAVVALALLAGAWFLLNRPTTPAATPAPQTSFTVIPRGTGSAVPPQAPGTNGGRPAPTSARTTPARSTSPRPPAGATDAASGLRVVRLDQLPQEAADTMRAIQAGPPFPVRKDGTVFSNFEGRLPKKPSGYYHEFTVVTPGENDRGARRIITGGPDYGVANGEFYYTPDHYGTFERITP